MADEKKDAIFKQPVSEPHGKEAPKDTTDWKAEARKWEARAKDNKSVANKLQQLKEVQMLELEKAQAEVEQAKAEAAKLKAEKHRTSVVRSAAQTTGVDFELLNLMVGESAEQIAANAELLKSKTVEIHVYPFVTDNGAKQKVGFKKSEIP